MANDQQRPAQPFLHDASSPSGTSSATATWAEWLIDTLELNVEAGAGDLIVEMVRSTHDVHPVRYLPAAFRCRAGGGRSRR
jgi:hypothetical protein